MEREKVIIVGGGPCGMSCAIELQKKGIDPLIIEKENIVNTLYNFPTHQTFFSSSEKLEIGEIPFITEKQKPTRNQALAYYRSVADRKQLRIRSFEKVTQIRKEKGVFYLTTELSSNQSKQYQADHVIIATGYYDQPNRMGVPGEELAKVMHYFKEAHPYYNKEVVIIGGKNSAIDAALELNKAGANITVLYRGDQYSKSIKPWILPDFDSLVRKDIIQMEFNAHVEKITDHHVYYTVNGEQKKITNDFVFAMTGYRPNVKFLQEIGIRVDPTSGKAVFNEETYETNIKDLFIAGVIAAGFNNNKIFIENGRFHGQQIAKAIVEPK
ncbi:YpdA family putative bacillithiol disulfide reductase [Ornithinibacillus sp. L9]|uniref:YpdA family putative bacillithiol disulfide reductase n=1 Tax=Ornithinibacillus caprae TaxID=2678566 RepID=A0A6N8FIU3_9BACI|nr:YpdA family putative bacillithiol disulfide reductase [Ornithinibacillus caprae]MUK87248.1 YpdA family putative bacillithiol disulfide reductase [Ornithinibacillus caprae]